MNQNTLVPVKDGFTQLTSTATTDVESKTLDGKVSAVLLTVETTNARVTFDPAGVDPDTTHGHVFAKDAAPVLVPVGAGTVIRHASTAGTNSVLNITPLE